MKELTSNWSEYREALVSDLPQETRLITEQVMENQRREVLSENAAEGSTRGNDIAGFRRILMPMIRRVIPGTIATEIVGVQPMKGPVDQIYTMRFLYQDGPVTGPRGGLSTGNATINRGTEAFGNDHYSYDSSPIYGFYSGGVEGGSPAGVLGQEPGAGGFGPGAPGPIDGDDEGAYATGGAWYDIEGESRLDGCTSGGHGGAIEGSGGRPMSLQVVAQTVEAATRRLQTSWTIEAMQDAQSQHGMNIENEMVKALSAQIVQEIDNEIIADLVALAGTVSTWDGSNPGTLQGYAPAFIGDRFANLTPQINYVANEIGRKTRLDAGNFIVVSPMVVSILQTAAQSVFAPSTQGTFKGPNGSQLVGTLNGRIKVYSYLWSSVQPTQSGGTGDDTILVGYKGTTGETSAGYFYCPLHPITSTGTILNPDTYQPQLSLFTRYGKAMFTESETSLGNSADYYGKVNITGASFA